MTGGVAFLWSWLTDNEQAAAVASALASKLPSDRYRANASQHDPGGFLYVRRPDGSWTVLSALWMQDIRDGVRLATPEERAK